MTGVTAAAAAAGGGGEKPNERPVKSEDHNLIVALRIRPLTEDEILEGTLPIAHKVDNNMVTLMDPFDEHDDILRMKRSREKQFIFDITLDGSASQQDTYDMTSKFLIPNVMNGYNATVFAYGATGSGKTHTMLGTDTDPGIMARALNDLFLEMERMRDTQTYEVTMSYLEIYNEMIRDLLRPSSGYLDLREDAKGVQVSGLSSVSAKSTDEVMEILSLGNCQRMQEPTAANKTSSRSHAVLRISVRQRSRLPLNLPAGRATRRPCVSVRLGRLFLVDLAGSERAANTQNRGQRMIEGAHINRSLLALGNCINALSDRNGTRYVNYRDSKLTRLLKDALGGNCKTVMIAHISPAGRLYEESRNTLAYAHRAKNIRNKVRCNVLDVSYHIAQYTNIISELQTEVKRLRTKLEDYSHVEHNPSAISVIQSEVMEAARRDDETSLNKLKQQLLVSFKHQMTIRRSLVELSSTVMAIDLESSRNELLIKTWDTEKELRDEENVTDWDGEKECMADVQEPETIKAARDELDTLWRQKEELEKRQTSLMAVLEEAKGKTAEIEQLLPVSSLRSEQHELISLLRRVHELETENLAAQKDRLSRRLQLRRRDLALAAYRRHLGLCDEIIRQQRALLGEGDDNCPHELRQLYAIYKQRMDDGGETGGMFLPDINAYKSTSLSDMSHLLDPDDHLGDPDPLSAERSQSTVTDQDHLRLPQLVGSTSFSNLLANKKHVLQKSSAKLAEIGGVDTLDERGYADGAQSIEIPVTSRRQRSIITLIDTHSSDEVSLSPPTREATPPQQQATPPRQVAPPQQATPPGPHKEVIASNTRNIAQLAARRRHSRAQLDALNSKKTQPMGNKLGKHDGNPTHLERHAERSPITLQEFLDDQTGVTGAPPEASQTDLRGVGCRRSGLVPRAVVRGTNRSIARHNGSQRTNEARGHVGTNTTDVKSRSRSRLPGPRQQKTARKQTSNKTGPNTASGSRSERLPAPSIPSYRMEDITVKGLGLYR